VNKQQALYVVASHVAGLLQAGSFEEATGVREDDGAVSEADYDRLSWALDEVVRRLDRLGTPPPA